MAVVTLWGCSLLGLALAVHLAWWRLRLPKNQLATLLKLFLAVFFAWIAFLLLAARMRLADGMLPSPVQAVHIALFYLAMAFSYVGAFTTIDADSPSLRMTLAVYNAGAQGLSRQELVRNWGLEQFFVSRVQRLVDDRMLTLSHGRYQLLPKGKLLMRLVVAYRKVMGASEELG